MTTQTNPQFPSAIGNEQVSYIPALWSLCFECFPAKKCLKAVEDFCCVTWYAKTGMLLCCSGGCYHEFKNIVLTSLTSYSCTLVIFLFAATEINKPGGKVCFVFFKPVSSSASPKLIDNGLFNFRDVAVSWQSPLCCLFFCAPWTETQAIISGTYTSVSKLQENLSFCASPGWLPKPNVIACPADVWRALTICNSPCLTPCTELFKIQGLYSLVTF